MLIKFKKSVLLLAVMAIIVSCGKSNEFKVETFNYVQDSETYIEISVPKYVETNSKSEKINESIQNQIKLWFGIVGTDLKKSNLESCAQTFNKSYLTFKEQMHVVTAKDLPKWEVVVNGDVLYQDEFLNSVILNADINTGAVKGISKVSFLNFSSKTGELLQVKDMVKDEAALSSIVLDYLNKEKMTGFENPDSVTLVNQKENGLPESFGFNTIGAVFIYQTNTNDFIEFVVPFDLIEDYLTF